MELAKEAQGIRLVATFLVLTSKRQRPLGDGVRLLEMAGQQLRLPVWSKNSCGFMRVVFQEPPEPFSIVN
jgi:hypothetical protein